MAASAGGDLQALVAALDPSVVYRADGGGLVSTARKVVRGADRVARLVLGVLGRVEPGVAVDVRLVNGRPGRPSPAVRCSSASSPSTSPRRGGSRRSTSR